LITSKQILKRYLYVQSMYWRCVKLMPRALNLKYHVDVEIFCPITLSDVVWAPKYLAILSNGMWSLLLWNLHVTFLQSDVDSAANMPGFQLHLAPSWMSFRISWCSRYLKISIQTQSGKSKLTFLHLLILKLLLSFWLFF